MTRGEKEPPPVSESQPPEWLPKAHSSADLGYVGFFPPHPDQEEEVLTEANVKAGLALGPWIPLEFFHAEDIVRQGLVSENALGGLEDLMDKIIARKAEDCPSIPSSTFRLPSRVTLNDTKRQAWFADLANPDVPLHKLGKSVPHGAKGHDLLDLLHKHGVAVPRAVWFLRVFGGNETAGLRNKPQYNPTQYSVDWANLVTGYIRKQLIEIALPMAPRPGLNVNVKQNFKGTLTEEQSRNKWLAKFIYTLDLLRAFYAEGLVDNRTFLSWLVQQAATCNLAQLGFVARLSDQYLDGIMTTRALARPLVEACLSRLFEIRTALGKEHLAGLEQLLKSIVLRVILVSPDAFVNPRLWLQHASIVEDAVSEHLDKHSSSSSQQNLQALNQTFIDTFTDIRRRNNAMLFRDLPPRVLGSLSSALSDIKLLNSLSGKSDLGGVTFFGLASDDMSVFPRKLDILLTWSVTPLQYGDHRSYAAVNLLRFWRDRAEERALRRGRDSPDDFVHDQLFDWLDSSDVAADAANLQSVALLYGQLIKHGLFSYPQYIQRLIARGETGLDFGQEQGSRHRCFLKWVPLHSSSQALISQRKLTLYGVRARETPEDVNERSIRKQIRELLPEVFGGTPDSEDMKSDFSVPCDDLFKATRFEQVRVIHSWLLHNLKKFISTSQRPNSDVTANNSALKSYCIATVLMARCRCYGALFELTLDTLERATSNELLTAVIRTIRQHVEVWACMNRMHSITSSLFAAHLVWKARGVQSRPLLILLLELDDGRLLETAAREQVLADSAAFAHALHPSSDNPEVVPAALPEILLLATDQNPEAASALANSLWYKYRSAADWAWKVWDNAVASLRQVPVMIKDIEGRRICGSRYAMFLIHVDQHLPTGFDDHILSWFSGSGRNEIIALTAEAWDVMIVVLLHLSIHGALATTTILTGLVYPVWLMGSSASTPQQGASLEVLLNAVNILCDHLLLQETHDHGYPPATFYEVQGLQTRRRDVFRHPHFVPLVENIPTLVLIEHNTNLSDHLRQQSRTLRESLCGMSVFRLGIYRDLDTVHRAFERVLSNHEIPEERHEALVNALRLMFAENHDSYVNSKEEDWQILSSALSPWKLAATSIELRFTIKQLSEALTRDGSRDRAQKYLNHLTSSLFSQGMNSEEVDFVAQMVKGASTDIIGKFMDAGLRRILDVLKQHTQPQDAKDFVQIVSDAGEVLRLLISLVEPLRRDPTTPEAPDSATQEELAQVVHSQLSSISSTLAAYGKGESNGINIGLVNKAVAFLARVVQFALGLRNAWTTQLKSLIDPFCATLVDLIILYGSGLTLDTVLFPLLIDTLYYILDEIPVDPKAATYDPFASYPKLEMQTLPLDMPAAYRARIRYLLPFVPTNAAVADLAYLSKDPNTGESQLVPVQNRPWEWTEFLGDRSPSDSKTDKASDDTAIKNSASLSLELFDAKVIGKALPTADGERVDHRAEGNLRTFQEVMHVESVFRRDWRESRADHNPNTLGAVVKGEQDDEVGPLPTFGSQRADQRTASRMASPVSSVRSRASVQPAQHTPRSQALRTSGSTAGDAIDVDSLDIPTSTSVSQGTKRKASADGDEVEVVSGPVIASQTNKKQKGKSVATSSKSKISKKR